MNGRGIYMCNVMMFTVVVQKNTIITFKGFDIFHTGKMCV